MKSHSDTCNRFETQAAEVLTASPSVSEDTTAEAGSTPEPSSEHMTEESCEITEPDNVEQLHTFNRGTEEIHPGFSIWMESPRSYKRKQKMANGKASSSCSSWPISTANKATKEGVERNSYLI
ncbi:hypothetical protein SKAU_G00091620 [Synaphobranchus kaupii]|uniref:Uncharacterized protein n=1 Tax=Synaphobranchus kaupii TaxID=118154 RepID=A0A9Q1FXC6_SYNKA|nr:hypothetical protein SKAU_G00091620 [Synaphobranchus kaupii]